MNITCTHVTANNQELFIEATATHYDDDDCGIVGWSIEDYDITEVDGHKLTKPQQIKWYKKAQNLGWNDRIVENLVEAIQD